MSTHALLPDWEPGYVRDLARATRLTYEPERLFGMLMAYLDDSQAPDDAPLYVIAGYVATATQWDQFEHAWSRFLALEGVECWSMRKFAQRKPPFDWDDQRRKRAHQNAIKIVNDHTLFAAYGAVASDEYHAIVPTHVRKKLGHEYPLCYQLCLMSLLDKLAGDRKDPPLEQVLVVLDQGNKVYGKVQARHELMRKYPLVLGRRRLSHLFQEDKRKLLGLQAADLLAYEIGKRLRDVRRLSNGERRARMRASLKELVGPDESRLVGALFNPDELRKFARA